jgi:uncharacterized repeat protein (TIGR01451 family)
MTSSADVVIEKTPPAALVPGTNAVWTITVTNGGPADALDVVVTDALDPSLTFVSSAPAICAAAGQAVTCSVGTVAAGGGTVIELTTAVAPNVPAGAVLTNAAAVQASTPDPDPADNATGDVAAPGAAPSADLRILKVPPGEVVPGQETPWRLTVVNLGPSDAVGVTIQDTLGAGTTFAASDPATCTAAGQDVTCDVGVVAAGATASVDVTVLVNAALPAGSTISNSATVSATTDDPLPANNVTGLVAAPAAPNADLSVTKTAPSSMVAGANVTWAIQVVNAGPSQATGVVVTDTLDPNLAFVSSAPPICTAAGQDVTCALGDLAAAGQQTVELTTRLAPGAAPGTVITNASTVESATADLNPADNVTAPVSSPPVTAAADLFLTKAPPSSLLAGTESSWTIEVTNNGPSAAQDVVVSDTLDPALSFVSSTPPICTAAGPAVTCPIATLGAGVTTSVVVTTRTAADIPDGAAVSNSAAAMSSAPDPNPVDNLTPPIAVEVEARADVSVDVDIAPEQVRQGAQLTVDVAVASDGPSAAVPAGAVLTLGPHLSFVGDNGGFSTPAPAEAAGAGAQPTGEPCLASGPTLSCIAGVLLAGESAQAAITVRVSATAPIGTRITLTAELANGTPDENAANDTDQDSVVIVAAPAQAPPSAPPTTPPPTTTSPAVRPTAPRTGVEVSALLLAAAALLVLGAAAAVGSRLRRAQSA